MQISGLIESVQRATIETKWGPKEKFTFKIGGQLYGVFGHPEYWTQFQMGQQLPPHDVDIKTSSNGTQYRNLIYPFGKQQASKVAQVGADKFKEIILSLQSLHIKVDQLVALTPDRLKPPQTPLIKSTQQPSDNTGHVEEDWNPDDIQF